MHSFAASSSRRTSAHSRIAVSTLSVRWRCRCGSVRPCSRQRSASSRPKSPSPRVVVRYDLETLTARGLRRADVGDEVRCRYSPTSADPRRYADLLAGHYYGGRCDLVVRTA